MRGENRAHCAGIPSFVSDVYRPLIPATVHSTPADRAASVVCRQYPRYAQMTTNGFNIS